MLTYDVRTDTLLMGTVIFSLWQMAIYLENRKLINLFFASVGVGLAMLTKGPIGILVPVFTFLPILILKKEWNKIFDWKYVVAFLVVGLLLLPMCIGLYQQFGFTPLAQPERFMQLHRPDVYTAGAGSGRQP